MPAPACSAIAATRDESARVSAGVLSYLAPELLEWTGCRRAPDIYTAGRGAVSHVHGLYPYGTIASANHAAFGEVDAGCGNPEGEPAGVAR